MQKNLKAIFFDMDGVLYDSMPFHAIAWVEAMNANGLDFTKQDVYLNEGRTGKAVIKEAFEKLGVEESYEGYIDDLCQKIYAEKSAWFNNLCPDGAKPMSGIHDVLNYLKRNNIQCWVVTGSGQKSLLDRLNRDFPGIFIDDQAVRVISSFDVTHGKPDPEPYLKAWERSGFDKKDCMVIENAPLGIRAGKAADLFSVAVNTGILPDKVLTDEGADMVFKSMQDLLNWLNQTRAV